MRRWRSWKCRLAGVGDEKDRSGPVGAAVAHDADGFGRQQHGKGLPDGVVEAGFADLVDIDGAGLAQDVELFFCNVAGAADREARARERMAAAAS